MVLRLAVVLGFMGGLFVLSSIPGHARPDDWLPLRIAAQTPRLVQKILHVLLYGGLGWLWFWVLAPLPVPLHTRVSVAFLIAVGFGALNEWHQAYLPGRYGTFADVLLNALGASFGLLIAVLLTG